MSEVLVFSGLLSLRRHGDTDEALFLSSYSDPLAEELEIIAGKVVTARYWITKRECSKKEAADDFVRQLSGAAETEFVEQYSEITGYLWTDENIKIGGHDLLNELWERAGSWLILEVVVQ